MIAAVFTMTLAACAKEYSNSETVQDNEAAAGPAKTLTFEASLSADTKISLGALTSGKMPVYWSEGDKLAAIVGSSSIYSDLVAEPDADNAKKCTFSISDFTKPASNAGLAIFYPSEGASATSGGVKFTLPAEQTCAAGSLPEGSAGPLAAVIADAGNALEVYENGGSTLTFRNVFGLLAFNFPKADIQSVTFRGNGNEEVAGTYVIAADGTLGKASATSESVTLKPEGSAFEAGKTYYMAVAPQTFDNGFTLTITTKEGVTFEKSTSKDLALNASGIKGLGNIETPSDLPVLKTGTVQNSWYMTYVPMTLTSDGGNTCEVGICWKDDGSAGATIEDNVYTYQYTAKSGASCFGSATWMDFGKTYKIRPWVKYGDKIAYYPEVNGKLEDTPAALNPVWTDISSTHSMPSSIKLYKTSTTVTGKQVNAWYAIADMSKGDIQLRTIKHSGLTTPENIVKYGVLSNVYVIINGGFFDSNPQSYSYVMDQGTVKATGITSVSRTFNNGSSSVSRAYRVTRGAFGVNENQEPSVKWLYANKDWAYDSPLPTYNSGPTLELSYPFFETNKQSWDIYSAMGGGPMLLHDGRIPFDFLIHKDPGGSGRYIGNPEMLQDDIFGPSVRQPRTAIGYTEDGKIVLMVVDGRNAGGSQGATLVEMAQLMKGIGCTHALNLDGGGSTTMRVSAASTSSTRLNTPSDGSERNVFTFVAFTKK